MGREAACRATWGTRSGDVRLLLETNELIVRGAIRATVARSDVRDVCASDSGLTFVAAGERVTLDMPSAAAARWAKALTATPPSLAKKLGITPGTRVAYAGPNDCPELAAAIAAGTSVRTNPALIIARIDDAGTLHEIVASHAPPLATGTPIWIVYEKGPKSPFGETAVRALMREAAFTDTKVASVSARFTALRFSRKAPAR